MLPKTKLSHDAQVIASDSICGNVTDNHHKTFSIEANNQWRSLLRKI